MKRFKTLIIALILICVTTFVTSCDVSKYKAEDVKNLYKTTVENQIDQNSGLNTMFIENYTLNITYSFNIYDFNLSSEMTKNEQNLYTLNNIYNKLFFCIFKYFEDWNENFFEHADEKLSATEFTDLYNKLNTLNSALIQLNKDRDYLEVEIANNSINDISLFTITNYLHKLNTVVEKSLDFNKYFRDLHIQKIFSDNVVSSNTVLRTIDDMFLSLANLVYFDNIKPFSLTIGESQVCDLSLLVEACANLNNYTKIKYLDLYNMELSPEVQQAIDNASDLDIMNSANKYMYYSEILRQDILTLEKISANINYYKLSQYRYREIAGGIDMYESTIAGKEKTSYTFLVKVENFIEDVYLPILDELL